MLRFSAIEATRHWVAEHKKAGRVVGLVPTMGALHEGHLSLVRSAANECDAVLASVFVNPTQFAPGEDYDRYPRDLGADATLLEAAGADALFAPEVATVYPGDETTTVDVGAIGTTLEGAARPDHFRGVATIVLKLFGIAPADRAYFGQKDYQQTVVVRRMTRDLNVPIEIVVCPIVREPDGVAMSSRNAYLTPDERREAVALVESLRLVERLVGEGEHDAERLRAAVGHHFAQYVRAELEYVDFMENGTLTPVKSVKSGAVAVLAARLGSTRLLDNAVLGADAVG